METYMDQTRFSPPTLVRISEVVGPGGIFPGGRSLFYNLQAKGLIHRPRKLGRISVWDRAQLLREIEEILR
jgi:predicted DNA-binding transcriptional regulator AlpA